jgi:hypothetical protein
MNKKFHLLVSVLVLFLIISLPLYAADKVYRAPRGKEVILVMKVLVSPEIEEEFYSKYWDINGKILKSKRDRSTKAGEAIPSTAGLQIGSSVWTMESLPLGELGTTATVKTSIPKDRNILLNFVSVYPAKLGIFKVNLPILAALTVPEGENYIYVGTFVYEREGFQFKLKNVSRIDEFDDAQAIVKERYGNDARLIRVPLRKQDKEE